MATLASDMSYRERIGKFVLRPSDLLGLAAFLAVDRDCSMPATFLGAWISLRSGFAMTAAKLVSGRHGLPSRGFYGNP